MGETEKAGTMGTVGTDQAPPEMPEGHAPFTLRQCVFFGAQIGLLIGPVLAVLYSLLYVGLFFSLFLSTLSPAFYLGFLFWLSVCALPVSLIIGVLPALVLGIVTGGLIGVWVYRLRNHLTEIRAMFLGFFASLIGVAGVNAVFWTLADDFIKDYYVYLLGLPSVVYLLASIGMGWLIYERIYETWHPRGWASFTGVLVGSGIGCAGVMWGRSSFFEKWIVVGIISNLYNNLFIRMSVFLVLLIGLALIGIWAFTKRRATSSPQQ